MGGPDGPLDRSYKLRQRNRELVQMMYRYMKIIRVYDNIALHYIYNNIYYLPLKYYHKSEKICFVFVKR